MLHASVVGLTVHESFMGLHAQGLARECYLLTDMKRAPTQPRSGNDVLY